MFRRRAIQIANSLNPRNEGYISDWFIALLKDGGPRQLSRNMVWLMFTASALGSTARLNMGSASRLNKESDSRVNEGNASRLEIIVLAKPGAFDFVNSLAAGVTMKKALANGKGF